MKLTADWFRQPWIRWPLHVLFIAGAYLLLLQVFKSQPEAVPVDHVYTLLFMATLLPVVYLNLEWLLPKLGKKKSWIGYGILLLGLIAAFSWINIELFNNWSARLLPQFYFISYYTWQEVAAIFTAFVVITTLLKLSKSWFALSELQQKLLTLEKERVDMELAALKAQVNPHFFFNTLNSIYSLSLNNDKRLPATVLQLSEIMRYYLYESRGEKVPLEKEVTIMRDYIQLQQIRSNDQLDLQQEVDGVTEGRLIPPLLLITLVENAFKHGAKGVSGASFIHIDLRVDNGRLAFCVKNNKGKVDRELDEKGLGLKNVRRRLELLYPDRHELKIIDTLESFSVQLNLVL